MSEPVLYGYTKKMDLVHATRKSKVIHRTSRNGGCAWLFHPKPDWDPTHPLTCPECLKVLAKEKEEEAARTPQPPLSPVSPVSKSIS